MKRKLALVVTVVLVLGLLAGCSGETKSDEVYTLKMSTQLNESSPMVQGFNDWADRVKERTNGKVIIEIFPSAQLGSDEDVIEQAIQGVNVAVLTDGGRMANYVNDIGIIGMPYIAANYDELLAITETSVFDEWVDELSKENGIRVLSFNWYDGPRHFLTNKPITTPADLSGVRVRTPGAPVWSESVAAMGATPIAMGWTETYNGVQSRAIDGAEAQHTATYGQRLFEVLSYINKTEHFQLANGIIVGEKWFNTLPEEYQTILVEECRAAAASNARLVEQIADEYEDKMVEEGMTVIEVDKEAFRKAAEAAYDKLGFSDLRNRIYEELGK
ncbi:C4-dicarboxylate TRAP transporter substrate-binding protein [Alkaliphilus peptidifermentans]|uniref:Tripartite ATP-independent transporter solute receptor, DctP family n=1 Tax=Alkaliphilus peptidifermentans DSM 18978 TaxID=1120976 RepID=A0A1G5L593_9FIRM|nr:C4-dicarboxylate TRAP transporter substrate-binding protein [Alkaliphilus peptidifermentans]SCZ07966.1 tripartite ATP-independent transporter solute receptor, DctP family [Alkaliphilus peptidifermentans DSM 18978]